MNLHQHEKHQFMPSIHFSILWPDRLCLYSFLRPIFIENDIGTENKKYEILLSRCGADTYRLFKNLAAPRKPENILFNE